MFLNLKSDTLFIIPCCKTKQSGGISLYKYNDELKESVSLEVYQKIISARKELLKTIKQNQKYISNDYSKNKNIEFGPDFGMRDSSGKYLPTIDRYIGKLYSAEPNFSDIIKRGISNPDKPKIIILSALYGPLDPLSIIQDYNLKMGDSPAFKIWKEYFPNFLRDYISRNQIIRIHLYLGSTTNYLKVAKNAILPLLKKGLINQAIQFEVEKGNSFHTPKNHGRLVLAHFQNKNVSGLTRNIRENILKLEIKSDLIT